MSLDKARAKLLNPDLGQLTRDEMTALIKATAEPIRTHGALTDKLIEDILDITAAPDRDTAKAAILAKFQDLNVAPAIIKTWSDDDTASIKTGA
jgi:hypothetical protein